MEFVNELPMWALALLIFVLRIVNMSLCTLPALLATARSIDPELFFVVERAQGAGHGAATPHTRWHAAFKRR